MEEFEYSGSDLDLQHEPTSSSSSVQRRGHAFSPETVAVLRAYHLKGMVGTGKTHSGEIGEAARETKLQEEQVKVIIANSRLRVYSNIKLELPPSLLKGTTTQCS